MPRINDYIVPLDQPEIPPEPRRYSALRPPPVDRPGAVRRRPSRAADGERIVAFAAAVRARAAVVPLDALRAARGAGRRGRTRRCCDRVAAGADGQRDVPGPPRRTAPSRSPTRCTRRYGIVPRMPAARPHRPAAAARGLGELPSPASSRVPFEAVVGRAAGRTGHRRLAGPSTRSTARAPRRRPPADHRFLRAEGRHGWLYVGPDGAPVATATRREAGRLGPVASRDPDLLAPILGHLTRAVVPRGAFALWVAGGGRARGRGLAAGFRLDGFPVLLCWDQPFADFSRYLPISPGLL